MTKEKQIQDYMTKLDLTREEAEQLWKDDHDDIIGEEGEALSAKAKTTKRRYEKSGKPRKPSTKERKVDETKKRLMADVKVLFEGLGADFQWGLTETELNFNFEDSNYTIKLTKHRTPKAMPKNATSLAK